MIQQRAAEANKAALEVEKERDELHNQIEQIEEQLHPKRARTHDAAGAQAHQKLVEKLVRAHTNLVMRESLDDTLRGDEGEFG